MDSFPTLIDKLGGAAAIAHFAGEKPGTIQQMKNRKNVRPEYWPALIAFAQQQGKPGVTAELLTQLAVKAAKARAEENKANKRKAKRARA